MLRYMRLLSEFSNLRDKKANTKILRSKLHPIPWKMFHYFKCAFSLDVVMYHKWLESIKFFWEKS